MWEMLSTVPAMLVRAGLLLYRHSSIRVYICQSGLSSIMRISWPMMPCSLATLSSVK